MTRMYVEPSIDRGVASIEFSAGFDFNNDSNDVEREAPAPKKASMDEAIADTIAFLDSEYGDVMRRLAQ